MHSRDVTDFLAFFMLWKGDTPKRKKKNQTVFTAQSTAEHQLQQPSSSTKRAGTGPSVPGIPPFAIYPPTLPPKKIHFSSLVSASNIPFFPVTIFSARHLLSDHLRRHKKPK